MAKNDLVIDVVAGIRLDTAGVVNQKEVVKSISEDLKAALSAVKVDSGVITLDPKFKLSKAATTRAQTKIRNELTALGKGIDAKKIGSDITADMFDDMYRTATGNNKPGAAKRRKAMAQLLRSSSMSDLAGMQDTRLARSEQLGARQQFAGLSKRQQSLYNTYQKGSPIPPKDVKDFRTATEAAERLIKAQDNLVKSAKGGRRVSEPLFKPETGKEGEIVQTRVGSRAATTPSYMTGGAALPSGGVAGVRDRLSALQNADEVARKSAETQQKAVQAAGVKQSTALKDNEAYNERARKSAETEQKAVQAAGVKQSTALKDNEAYNERARKSAETEQKAVQAAGVKQSTALKDNEAYNERAAKEFKKGADDRAAGRAREAQDRQKDRDASAKITADNIADEENKTKTLAKEQKKRAAINKKAQTSIEPGVIATNRARQKDLSGFSDADLKRRLSSSGAEAKRLENIRDGSRKMYEFEKRKLALVNQGITATNTELAKRKKILALQKQTTAAAERATTARKAAATRTTEVSRIIASGGKGFTTASGVEDATRLLNVERKRLAGLKKLSTASDKARVKRIKGIEATIRLLNAEATAIRKNASLAASGGGRIPPGAAQGVNDLNKGVKGLNKGMSETGTLLKNFFRYALGYGALYKVIGAVTALTKGVIELDKELKSIQAISQATEEQMLSIEAAVKGVATTTKFSVQEIAKAARTLAQAGVEPEEINSVLSSVAQFAAGTETALATAADVASTMRNVFKELDDTQIADKLTKAINISKLTGEDLKVILSISAQIGKSFELSGDQYLAAATTLRNAGLKASTVATGLRQGLLEIFSPDAKSIKALKARYSQIGEALNEGDIRKRFQGFQSATNPLLAALRELNRLGFTGEGKKTFARAYDIRAENAISALINNLDKLEEAEARISLGGAAAEASTTQMESLTYTLDNLGAAMTVLAADITEGPIKALQELAKEATNVINTLDEMDMDLKAAGGAGVSGIFETAAAGAVAGATVPGGGAMRRVVGGVAGAVAGGYYGYGQAKKAQSGEISAKEMEAGLDSVNTLLTLLAVFSLTKGKGAVKLAGAGAAIKTFKASLLSLGGFFTGLKVLGKGLLTVLLGFARANPIGLALTGLWLAYEAYQAFADDVEDETRSYEDLQTQLKAAKQRSTRGRQERSQRIKSFEDFQLTDYESGVESGSGTSAAQLESSLAMYGRAKTMLDKEFVKGSRDLDEVVTALEGTVTGPASEAGSGARKAALENIDKSWADLDAAANRRLAEIAYDVTGAKKQILAIAKGRKAEYDRLIGGDWEEDSRNAKFIRIIDEMNSRMPRMLEAWAGDISAREDVGGMEAMKASLRGMYQAMGEASQAARDAVSEDVEDYADEFKLEVAAIFQGLDEGEITLTEAKNRLAQELDKLSRTGVTSFETVQGAVEHITAKLEEVQQMAEHAAATVAGGRAFDYTPEQYAEAYRRGGAEMGPMGPVSVTEARREVVNAPARETLATAGVELGQKTLDRLTQAGIDQNARTNKQIEDTWANAQESIAILMRDEGFSRRVAGSDSAIAELVNAIIAGDKKLFTELFQYRDTEASRKANIDVNLPTKFGVGLGEKITKAKARDTDTTNAQFAILEQQKYAPDAGAALKVAELDVVIAKLKKTKSPELFAPDSPIYKRANILGRELEKELELVNENITAAAAPKDLKAYKQLQTLKKKQGELMAKRVKLDAATNTAVADQKFAHEKRALQIEKEAASAEKRAIDQEIANATLAGDAETLSGLQKQRVEINEKLIVVEEATLLHSSTEASLVQKRTEERRTAVAAEEGRKRATEAIQVSDVRLRNIGTTPSTGNVVQDARLEAEGRGFTNTEKLDSYARSVAAITTERDRLQDAFDKATPAGQELLSKELDELNIQLEELRGNITDLTATPLDQLQRAFDPQRMLVDIQELDSAMQNLGDSIREEVIGAIDEIGPSLFDAVVDSSGVWDTLRDLAGDTFRAIGQQASASLVNTLAQKALGAFGAGETENKIPQMLQAPTTANQVEVNGQVVYVNGPVMGGGSGGGSIPSLLQDSPALLGTTPQIPLMSAALPEGTPILDGMLQNLEEQTAQGDETIQKSEGWFSGLGSAFDRGITGLGGVLSSLFGSSTGGQAASGIVSMLPQLAALFTAADGATALGTSQGSVSAAGIISGPGTGTSDAIAAALFSPAGVSPVAISAGESILTARATSALGVNRIAAWNRGTIKGFSAGMTPAAPASIAQVPAATPNVNASTRIINVLDPSLVSGYMTSSSGEKVILNTIQRNPSTVKRSLG